MTTTTRATTIDRLLDAICAGTGVPAELLAPDAVLDATVPGWRFPVEGGAGVAAQYSHWFAAPGEFEELERRPVEGGEVVTYLLAWLEGGIPYAARHCHVFELDEQGRIARDQFFCGGVWDAARLAEMAAAQHASASVAERHD